ncbi:prolyl oligopeptidase family serine peptidase [Bacillus sp. CH30_1T]|uniref:carboxylesterase family protein n=1 Tax=Bacillus sp. CH30_1T TaxID=2604836 RepID=UPI0011EDB2C7|nr:prolyl oligopeptidase family serine peptidase [Bacillus sp. CH30_1T]KAA0561215.1 prolyl oligopeptidase family serine peptidase [Bacillus sp. CH30_1T]
MQKELRFDVKDYKLNYLLYLPDSFQQNGSLKWPLILFLHGAGERGGNMELVKKHGVPKIVENQEEFPFIVVSPQCPADSYWVNELESLSALLDEIVREYPIDPARIYLTGLSMGGIGAWHLAIANPKRFAAIAPVCGALSIPEFRRVELQIKNNVNQLSVGLKRLKDLPVWAFHGDQDDIVPIEAAQKVIQSLKKQGGSAKLTVYKGVGHDSWTETYENEELYIWFLNQHKIK